MPKDQKIAVFGRVKSIFEIKEQDYQNTISGLGYQIATNLSQNHQVYLYTQLADDFLSEQIVHQLNAENVSLINTPLINKTECEFIIDDKLLELQENGFDLNFENQQYDWIVITDIFKNKNDFSELLHEAKDKHSKVAYVLENPITLDKLDYLMEDIDFVIISQDKLFEITKTDILTQAIDRFRIKTDNFLIVGDKKIIACDQNSTYKTNNFSFDSSIKFNFLKKYIETRNIKKTITKVVPKDINIRESGNK